MQTGRALLLLFLSVATALALVNFETMLAFLTILRLRDPGGSHSEEENMSHPEEYDVVVLGSGAAGKLLAWTLASQGKRWR